MPRPSGQSCWEHNASQEFSDISAPSESVCVCLGGGGGGEGEQSKKTTSGTIISDTA